MHASTVIAKAVFAMRASSRPMLPYPMIPRVALRTGAGRNSGQRWSSGGQPPVACHATMRGTRWARASSTVIAYSAMVAACTPLVVVSGIALCV